MKRFTREDLQRVHTVYEHLAFIRNEWGEKIDHASLRRGSASLHSLLTENLLRIIWAKTMEESCTFTGH